MSEALTGVYDAIDTEWSTESAHTRRKLVGGAAAVIGGMGLLGLPKKALAANDAQTILNIAATAEVLATIVNTLGPTKVTLDATTKRNVEDAAFQELTHYKALKSLGAKELTKSIWVPDAVFGSKKGLLTALVAGDGIFVNAYLIGVTAFAKGGKDTNARYAAEIMGVESVHRALALQSLGKAGNDLVYTEYNFTKIEGAVTALQAGGFGFGKKGSKAGKFYDFDTVSKQTKTRAEVTSRSPK
jgi:hypothetical protein